MSDRIRCRCPRCTIRGLLGPAVVITVGVLFLLQQMRGNYFDFGNTYPVILVVIGAILLASENGVKVALVNPHEVKARKGHKTDAKDSWWLAHLLRHA